MVIGLTGNFGMGKSTVAGMFRRKGARVLSADRLAHEALGKGHGISSRVKVLFPELNGKLDRRRIASLVFRDSKRRHALERLIHPLVFQRIREETGKTERAVVIVEVPLLFETGFDRHLDRTIVVKAGEAVTLKRLRRRGFSPQEVRRRWRAQGPLREKLRRSDWVIDNSNGLRRTGGQVDQIWKQLQLKQEVSNRERSFSNHGERSKQQSRTQENYEPH